MEQFFIPIDRHDDLRAKGAIIINDDLKPSEFKTLEVTRPGQYYAVCDMTGFKDYLKKHPDTYMVGFLIDWTRPLGSNVCYPGYMTEKQLKDSLREYYPNISDSQLEKLHNKELRISRAVADTLPDGMFYADLYYSLQYSFYSDQNNPTIKWALWKTILNAPDEWIRDIPIIY